jgi:Arc/MetJ-type ribon-helix-helix transcriptional regulator
MTIFLSKEQQRFIHDAVRAGLYSSEDEVIRDALARLQETLPELASQPGKAAKPRKASAPKTKRPMTEAEFKQHLLEIGLVTALPNPALDDDDDDEPPIVIKGEPLSETVIRERR